MHMNKALCVEQLFFRVPSCVLDYRGADLKGPGLARPGVVRAAQTGLGLGQGVFADHIVARAWAGPGCFRGPYRGHYGGPKAVQKASLGRERMRGPMESESFS